MRGSQAMTNIELDTQDTMDLNIRHRSCVCAYADIKCCWNGTWSIFSRVAGSSPAVPAGWCGARKNYIRWSWLRQMRIARACCFMLLLFISLRALEGVQNNAANWICFYAFKPMIDRLAEIYRDVVWSDPFLREIVFLLISGDTNVELNRDESRDTVLLQGCSKKRPIERQNYTFLMRTYL